MLSMQDKLTKLREERLAREKARIEKLRELNLKKYQDKTLDVVRRPSTVTFTSKKPAVSLENKPKPTLVPNQNYLKKPHNKTENSKIPDIILATKKEGNKVENPTKIPSKTTNNLPKLTNNVSKNVFNFTKKVGNEKAIGKVESKFDKRKSYVPNVTSKFAGPVAKASLKADTRKSIIPQPSNLNRESVFDRLYKPRPKLEKQENPAQRIHTDSKFRESVLANAKLLTNRRATTHIPAALPVRRSISAVHFKKISKTELANCNHKWSSIGSNLNQAHLKDTDEDASVKQDKITSAVKSERKKVKFVKQLSNMNTPRPEELQARLKSWLQKRGKSIDSFHHLQCFGLHHMATQNLFDEENKENIQVASDSDDDSFQENMNAKSEKWRRASIMSSNDCDETKETIQSEEMMHNADELHNVDELLLGALNDLAELLREGFDWEQSARWLRAIRERFPSATDTAAYWECRAALEERQGNLPGSVQCWEEAIAKGTERSVVEANLDQLLDKFMQLKISPNSAKKTKVSSKFVDVKNVFKSTIIRFAVQQAKLRQSTQCETPKFTVTPVRRSNRLSFAGNKMTPRGPRTPLVQICSSMRQIDESIAGKTVFVPNETLPQTP